MRVTMVLIVTGLMGPCALLAQTFDLLAGFSSGARVSFTCERTGIPTTFFFDTVSTFEAFSGRLDLTVDSVLPVEGGAALRYEIRIRQSGVRTVHTRLRTVFTEPVDTIRPVTMIEDGRYTYRAGSGRIRGWLFSDTVGTTPRCPGEPWGAWYGYPYYFRHYRAAPDDSLERHSDTLLLRTRITDCLDYGYATAFTITAAQGLVMVTMDEMNFFDWSSHERYIRTDTQQSPRITEQPAARRMYPNHPNPFTSRTTIPFRINEGEPVTIDVLDGLGRVVSTLVHGFRPPGRYNVEFDARALPAGVYVLRFATPEAVEMRPVLHVR